LTLKTIAKNAGWLGLIQVLNYVLPILTVPVVARAFGPSIYGILATFYAYASYVDILTGYGFNITGPRAIATSRNDVFTLSRMLSATIGAQFLLGSLGVVIFSAILFIIPYGGGYKFVCLIVLIQTFATSMAPQWVFLGMEETRNFAIIQMVFRALAVALILFVIRTPDDLLLFVSVNCVTAVLILIFSFLALARYDIRWRIPSVQELVSVIRQASRLFVSAVSISLYTTTNVLVVAFILGPSAAGAFALADRLRQATAGIIDPITQAVYPFVCRLAGQGATHEEAWAKRMFFRSIVGLAALISISLFAFAPLIIWLVGGKAFEAAVPVLRILAFLPVIVALSNTLGKQTLLPLYMDREFTWVVVSAALFGVTGLSILTYVLGLSGAALAILAVEMYVTIALAMIVQRRMSILSLFFKRP
jgi:O-antigen/teichoic acid export membrane protein